MSSEQGLRERLIWATAGRHWGFRFLLDGGFDDPLQEYERVFADLGEEATAYRHLGEEVALRFPDPRDRRDAAGRVILHEFVVSGHLAEDVDSAEAGLRRIWPLVADAYAEVWEADGPPSATDLHFAT